MWVKLSAGMCGTDQGVYKMTNKILSKHIGKFAVGSGLIAASIYALMTSVTLAHIEAVSGQVPFDMRPSGYGPNEAVALLDTLGVDGRGYYITRQIALDTIYPAMLALTMVAAIYWLGQRTPNRTLVRFGIAFSVVGGLFDYVENLGIVAMIWSWPEVSVPLVCAASSATIIKSVSTTLAVMLVLLMGLNWIRLSKADLHP
ncbi:hypothetical protein OIHEL45_03000 [Sulfitobacter indolifex HEL-45]|uniref:Uncharacterized protein n=2 Tax=Sulfitobacter indolifex TaxID=225422 RepID=A0ABM9X877_9RHOB|nr:hypothetical protein OIHEL45_03000 [Sulfitobacter indolifex HEL-45]